ncbi:MAG: V-type ATP synthase subunit D [Treponemataceae bacterium]|nr:V-type ATP synthase subunit D [Treponemataceae bacterium]
MAKLNIAPTKSNLLAMKDQLSIAQNGYDLLEQKREILVQELMRMVDKVKLLERDIDSVIKVAYPAFKRMLMADGFDRVERIAHAVHYDFEMHEKQVAIGGMSFASLDVRLPQRQLFYSLIGTYANTDDVIAKFFNLLSLLTQMASIRTIVWRLAEEVKKTQRRVNALDKLVIPQTRETKSYIENVLEEKERENVFVLKALKKRNDNRQEVGDE